MLHDLILTSLDRGWNLHIMFSKLIKVNHKPDKPAKAKEDKLQLKLRNKQVFTLTSLARHNGTRETLLQHNNHTL